MPKTKYSYKFIKDFIESIDYAFLTHEEDYVNVGQALKVRCSEGHVYTTRWNGIYHDRNGCRWCNKYSIKKIKPKFKAEGYTLLSTEYKNQYTKLEYICSRGHRHFTTWNTWQQKSRCPECVKPSYDEIVAGFDLYGYKVLSKEGEYTGNRFKFEYRCPKGHTSSMGWANFKYGYRCPHCSPGNVSKSSQKWLDSLSITVREYRINLEKTFIKVDGFDTKTNTVYEFLGDYWHGNPKKYSADKINAHNKKTFGQLYKEWTDRKRLLETFGYKVVYVWWSDFDV